MCEIRPNRLLRFLALNAIAGVALGEICLALLIASDAMGVGALIANAASPMTPLAMLAIVFGITFGVAVMATAVMSLPMRNGDDE